LEPQIGWVDCDIAAQLVRHLDACNSELYPIAAVSRSFRDAVEGVLLAVNSTTGSLSVGALDRVLNKRSSLELNRITRFRLGNVGAKFLDALAERVKSGHFESLLRIEARGAHAVLFYCKLIGLPCEAMPQRKWLANLSDEYLFSQMVIAAEDGTQNAEDFCSVMRMQRTGRDSQSGMTYRYWIGRNDATHQAASASWLNKHFDCELDPTTGREMIHLAAAFGRQAVLQQLRSWVSEDSPWDFSCFIFKPDRLGKTAVCYAVGRHDVGMLKFLLESSEPGEVLDDDPDIAVHPLLLCALEGREDLSLRRDAATIVPEYLGASKQPDVWSVMGSMLIEHSCNISAGSQEQIRPLAACIRTGDEQLFSALVDAAREEASAEGRPYVLRSSEVDMARLYGRDTMLRSLVWLEETSRCLP